MNAQQELVAYWKFCESRGLQPSVRAAIDHCRRMGVGVTERDAYAWLGEFAARNPHAQNRQKTARRKRTQSSRQHKTSTKTAPAVLSATDEQHLRAHDKVSLVPKSITEANASATKAKRMKQGALDLGATSAPEIDFDRKRLDMPEGLPEHFPDSVDDLRTLAVTFAQVFTYTKAPDKLRKHIPPYTEVLGGMRKSGIPVSVAWHAFREAVIAQEGAPLFQAQAKKAYSFLPNGRARYESKPSGPRVDSCGCKLPDGVFMPRIGPNETAHWDGEIFIYGSTNDPELSRR